MHSSFNCIIKMQFQNKVHDKKNMKTQPRFKKKI